MDHLPDHLLIDECKRRFIVLEIIPREELEECMETLLIRDEWKEIKDIINKDFYELIADTFDDYAQSLLRDIRVRDRQKNLHNMWHKI